MSVEVSNIEKQLSTRGVETWLAYLYKQGVIYIHCCLPPLSLETACSRT